MRRYRVEASVDPPYRRTFSGATLRTWAEQVMDGLDLPEQTGVTISVTGDERVQDLNRAYRGLDEPTDVLSFPFTGRSKPAPYHGAITPEGVEPEDFVVPKRAGGSLGEVVIAFPYAARQAAADGRTVRSELSLLLVHGILHLLGYDHEEAEEERVMWEKTADLLSLLGPEGPASPGSAAGGVGDHPQRL